MQVPPPDEGPTLALRATPGGPSAAGTDELAPTSARTRRLTDLDGRDHLTADLASRTLERDEILRSRGLGRVGLSLAALIAIVVAMVGGLGGRTLVVLVACAIVAAGNVALLVLSRDLNRFRAGPLAVVWLGAAVAVGAGVAVFGIYSPAPIVASLGIYFAALGNIRWLAYAVWLIIAGILGLAGVLTLSGAIDDPGLITAANLSAEHRAMLLVLLEALLVGVLVLGRHSRRATAMAVGELERASRALAQRDALLDEARHELDAALAAGGAGPWSGRTLDRYLIGKLLGRGGMGEVYEALGQGETSVAIKLLTPAAALDPRVVARFRREAEITAALASDHIVRVFAVSPPDAIVPYLVMERLSGSELADVLRKRVVLSKVELMSLLSEVASALDVAHEAGVVHRDIKPQNIFASDQGAVRSWKILDFGVSKLVSRSGTLTQGNVVGTPAYMAPEQACGEDDVGRPADTYALAAIAYRCLTGRPPFRGKSTAALLYKVVNEMPVRPSSLVRVPSAVDGALAIGLAKDPRDRPKTAGVFAAIMCAALSGVLDAASLAQARQLEGSSPWLEG